MTHNSRLVRRICVATRGSALVVLLLAAFGASLAQTPQTEPTPAPVASNPDSVDVSSAMPAASSQAYSPTIAQQAQSASAANPNQEQLNALRARMQELQSKLTRTPTTVQEQAEQQNLAVEISLLQVQIQRLETEAAQFGQYADYRRMREQQASGMTSPTGPVGAGSGIFANANPMAQQPLPDGRFGVASAVSEPVALSNGEAALLREQKDALTQRFHQLQQAIRSLMPGDEGLAENLKKEQDVVLEQLRDVNLRLTNAPATPTAPIVSSPTPFQIPAANQLPNLANATLPDSDLSVKTQKVQQAVQLLREAGLTQLASYAANEIPRMASPSFVETRLVPGAWAEGSGLAEERYNPFQQISAKDVEGITNSIDDLKKRVDSLAETLANVETQLKLLTRQQVSGYVPTTQPTAEASAPESEQTVTPATEPVVEVGAE